MYSQKFRIASSSWIQYFTNTSMCGIFSVKLKMWKLSFSNTSVFEFSNELHDSFLVKLNALLNIVSMMLLWSVLVLLKSFRVNSLPACKMAFSIFYLSIQNSWFPLTWMTLDLVLVNFFVLHFHMNYASKLNNIFKKIMSAYQLYIFWDISRNQVFVFGFYECKKYCM